MLLTLRYGWRYEGTEVWKAVEKAGLTRKVLEYRALEQSGPLRQVHLAARAMFLAKQIVFYDETHCKPNDLRRKYSYGFRGLPAFMYVAQNLHGTGTGCSGCAAMSLRGMIAVTVTDRIIDGPEFLRILEFEILPFMRPYPQPESVLVLDSAPTHSHLAVILLCQRFGVVCLFLSPYSYDFSAIEPSFHQAKAYCRSTYGLRDGITSEKLREGLASITPLNAVRYFRHVGITITRDDSNFAGVVHES